MADYKGESKTCSSCGRLFSYQKRWRNNWDSVRYCSDRCRREKFDKSDKALEQALLDLLAKRGKGKTICLSEAARAVTQDGQDPERSRRAARRLVAAGKLEILQNGKVVDPSSAKGLIHLRLK